MTSCINIGTNTRMDVRAFNNHKANIGARRVPICTNVLDKYRKLDIQSPNYGGGYQVGSSLNITRNMNLVSFRVVHQMR